MAPSSVETSAVDVNSRFKEELLDLLQSINERVLRQDEVVFNNLMGGSRISTPSRGISAKLPPLLRSESISEDPISRKNPEEVELGQDKILDAGNPQDPEVPIEEEDQSDNFFKPFRIGSIPDDASLRAFNKISKQLRKVNDQFSVGGIEDMLINVPLILYYERTSTRRHTRPNYRWVDPPASKRGIGNEGK